MQLRNGLIAVLSLVAVGCGTADDAFVDIPPGNGGGGNGGGVNSAPVADAGPSQLAARGEVVTLDGGGSFDADGDALTHAWTVAERPAVSGATLSDPGAVSPEFEADEIGNYVFELSVSDGAQTDTAVTGVEVILASANDAPMADAGADRSARTGDEVVLDGGGSFDGDGDPLSFSWAFTERPEGSVAALSDPMTVEPSFRPDLPGAYRIQLLVFDGQRNSAPDAVSVTVTGEALRRGAGLDAAFCRSCHGVTDDGAFAPGIRGRRAAALEAAMDLPIHEGITLGRDEREALEGYLAR